MILRSMTCTYADLSHGRSSAPLCPGTLLGSMLPLTYSLTLLMLLSCQQSRRNEPVNVNMPLLQHRLHSDRKRSFPPTHLPNQLRNLGQSGLPSNLIALMPLLWHHRAVGLSGLLWSKAAVLARLAEGGYSIGAADFQDAHRSSKLTPKLL